MWKIVMVIFLGLVGWVGLTMALTPTPQPNGGSTPIWIDMTPTWAYLQSSTTQDMINGITSLAPSWSSGDWQNPRNQAVYKGEYTTSETPEQVLAAFQEAFSTGDWSMTKAGPAEWKPVFTDTAVFSADFCYLQGHGTVSLGLINSLGGLTDVVVYINFPSRHYSCEDSAIYSDRFPQKRLPQLVTPQDVTVISRAEGDVTNGLIDSSYKAGVLLRSTRPLNEMAADYYEQLLAAGWQLVLEESTTVAAISTWNIPVEDGSVWTGIMVFTADTERDHYRAYVAMEPRP